MDKDTTIYFTFEDKVQNQLYSLDYNDPVTMSLNLKIEQLGDLEIIKTNKNGDLVDGTVFTVNGKSYNGDVTVKNGKIKLEKLKKGIYTVKEKTSSDGYLLNTETYKVEVKPNTTVTLKIENDEPKGTLDIVKVDSETNQKAAFCQGYSELLKLALNNIGIECNVINGTYKKMGNPEFDGHYWNQVKIGNVWYNCDLTWDSPKIKAGERIKYCLRNDSFFRKDDEHVPVKNKEIYPVPNEYDQNIINQYFINKREAER